MYGKSLIAPGVALAATVLAWIGGTTPARAFEEAEVRAIVRNPVSAQSHPGAGGIWMAREKVVRLDGSGGTSEREHLIARIFDPAWGRERFGPFVRDYWAENQAVRVVVARIWRSSAEAEELPREAVGYETSPVGRGAPAYEALRRLVVEFPELRAGDQVELVLEKSRRPRPGEYTVNWFSDVFGADDPVIEQQLDLQVPNALSPNIATPGTELRPVRTSLGGFASRQWLTGNLGPVPGGVVEGFASRRAAEGHAPAGSVVLGTSPWYYLSRYLGRQWSVRVGEVSGELLTAVGEMTAGSTDLRERARAIERYVREEVETIPLSHLVQGARPLPPAEVFRDRVGSPLDKGMLLTAALRAAGIDPVPVWIRTAPGPWAEEVGCPDQLDRLLVRVRSAGEDLWLDPIDDRPLPASVGLVLPYTNPLDPDAVADEEGLVPFPGRGAAAVSSGSGR